MADLQLARAGTVLARLAPCPGRRILDVACGTGRLTAEIGGAPGFVAIGLDPLVTLDYWRLHIPARKARA